MAAAKDAAGFCLPSEFLTDDDFLMDKENFINNQLHSDFSFPSEFPYHFEPHPDHLLQMSISPQSSRSDLGTAGWLNNASPNAPKSPLTMQYDAVGDLVRVAAGEAAGLKLNRGYWVDSHPPPRNVSQFRRPAKIPTPSVYLNTRLENSGDRAVRRVEQVTWPPHHIPIPVKKLCSGTGVFLPRRYENQNIGRSNAFSSGLGRKPGWSAPPSSSPFQGKASSQIQIRPYYDRKFGMESQEQRMGRAFISDINSMLATRQAVVQRRFVASLPEGSAKIIHASLGSGLTDGW